MDQLAASFDFLKSRLSGYQLLGGQRAGRFSWKERRRSKVPLLIGGVLLIVLALAWLFSGRKALHREVLRDHAELGPYVQYRIGNHWPSWSGINQMIVFGDSWSTTCWWRYTTPDSSSPIGLPAWPGESVGNGPNWVGYLTYQLNESLILTADFAIGGATVADLSHVDDRSVRSQVTRYFPAFNANHTFFWTPDTSLFFVWVGINDIHDAGTTSRFPESFVVLRDIVEKIYAAGARNFMFVNVPPLSRSPIATDNKQHEPDSIWAKMVSDWNSGLSDVAWSFADRHPDITLFFFDGWQLYNDIMDDPCVVPESCGFKATEEYCPMYSMGNVEWNTFDPKCPYSADQYFWIDPLHPTTVLQNVTAHAMIRALKSSEES